MNLSVLLKPVAGAWHAICLERFIVAQADSEENVIREFDALLAAEVAYGIRHGDPEHPLVGIPQAPPGVWDEFECAEPCDAPPARMTVMVMDVGDKQQKEIELPKTDDLRRAA